MNKSAWLFRRGSMWYVGWREEGRLRAVSSGTQIEQEATTFVEQKRRELSQRSMKQPVLDMTIDEAIKQYERENICATRTRLLNHYSWNMLRANGVKTLADCTRENIVRFIGELKSRYKPAGVSIQLRNTKKLLKFCVEKEWLVRVPFKRGDIPANESVARFLTTQEQATLIRACNPELQRLIKFTLLSGFRLSQAISLTWEQFKSEMQVIQLPGQKRQKARLFPVLPGMLSLMGTPGSGLVFQGWNHDRVEKMFRRAVRRSGIQGRIRFHDLRHSAASTWAAKLTPVEVRDLLGHSSIATTNLYFHSHLDTIKSKLTTL